MITRKLISKPLANSAQLLLLSTLGTLGTSLVSTTHAQTPNSSGTETVDNTVHVYENSIIDISELPQPIDNFTQGGTTAATSLRLPDYLTGTVSISPDQKQSVLSGMGLSWMNGGQTHGTGDFTIKLAGSNFEVNEILSDQTGTFDSGWNGKDLVKKGAGTLILSAENTYTGKTIIEEGTLVISSESNLGDLNGEGIYLHGTGEGDAILKTAANPNIMKNIYLKGDHNVFSTADSYSSMYLLGNVSGEGRLVVRGFGAVTLMGEQINYTGGTFIESGSLVLISSSDQIGGDILMNASTNVSFSQFMGDTSFKGNIISQNEDRMGLLSISMMGGSKLYLEGETVKASMTINGNTHVILSGTEIASQTITVGYGNSLTFANSKNGRFTGKIAGLANSQLIKKQTGTMDVHYSADSNIDNVVLEEGVLNFIARDPNQSVFTISNDLINNHATLGIGQGLSTLRVDGTLDLSAANSLHLTLNPSAFGTVQIQSDSTRLGGRLNVSGLALAGANQPILSASQLSALGTVRIIQSVSDIEGDFTNTSDLTPESSIDYLSFHGGISADRKGYDLANLRLRWDQGGDAQGAGTFTLDNASAFNVDVVLSNQGAGGVFASGWDGKSLTKKGAGLLLLSQENTYTGNTTVEGGTLRLATDHAIEASSALIAKAGATVELADTNQIVQSLKSDTGSTIDWGTTESGGTRNNSLQIQTLDAEGRAVQSTVGSRLVGSGTLQIGAVAAEVARAGQVALQGDLSDFTGTIDLQQGRLVLDGSKGYGQYGGTIRATSGTELSLTEQSQFFGNVAANGGVPNLRIDSSSSWEIASDTANAVDAVALAGTIRFSPPRASRQENAIQNGYTPQSLIAHQNWQGENGTVVVNTYFGDVDTAQSDTLVLKAGASGKTYIEVQPAGGAGYDTADSNGILVVDASQSSASTANAFTMRAPVIVDGVYQYQLAYQDLDRTGENWYLRSVTQAGHPDIRDDVFTYGAGQALTARYDLQNLGTYYQRAGASENRGDILKAWSRVVASHGKTGDSGYAAYMRDGASYQYNHTGMQLGHDVYRDAAENATTIVGLYGSYGQSRADVDGLQGGTTGDVRFNAYSLGLYMTYLTDSGAYADAVVQGSTFRSLDMKTEHATGTSVVSTSGSGYMASLEVGYPAIQGEGWKVEPQAQYVYQQTNLDDAQDDYSQIQFQGAQAQYGRLGVRVENTLNASAEANKDSKVWLQADLWNQFTGNAETTIVSRQGVENTFQNQLGKRWGSLGAGVSGYLTPSLSAFATLQYAHGIGSGTGNDISGQVGLKLEW